MHLKTVINFSVCTYWLDVVVDFLAQNSCFFTAFMYVDLLNG